MAYRMNIPSWLQCLLFLRRLDRWLLLALAMGLLAVLLHGFALLRQNVSVDTLNGATTQSNDISQWASSTLRLNEERLLAFRELLIDREQRNEWLKVIFLEAANAQLQLLQGDYALTEESEGDFIRLHIQLPVKGRYAQIRRYTQSLLEQIPALSLNEITFRRESVKTPEIEARLMLTLFLKEEK